MVTWSTESRWPAIIAQAVAFGLIISLPNRYIAVGLWFAWAVFGILMASMLAVTIAPGSALWHRVERAVVVACFVLVCVLNLVTLKRITTDMIAPHPRYGGVELLATAVALWLLNLLAFALLYWQADRATQEVGAVAGESRFFAFGEREDKNVAPSWEPFFVDYLFLAFAVSVSFTPPDYARPRSRPAKLLLMLQAAISLVTLVLIGARAVGTLS
jgi:hypothetical protein